MWMVMWMVVWRMVMWMVMWRMVAIEPCRPARPPFVQV